VIHGEQWEKFLARKYVGTKRFGLDGGESMIPALEAVIKYGGQLGVEEIVIGMAHRGRLNVLANVMGKPYRAIFSEFAGGSRQSRGRRRLGRRQISSRHLVGPRVRRHQGAPLAGPQSVSHLEAVDPVVLGKARAKQTARGDAGGAQVLPVLLHGDAAFAGQGIVAECFGFSGPRLRTGGTIHFIINNQVGFTTSPQFARSSPYPSDVAKAVQAPILHVNGDDPEAVTFACKLAIEFRQKFKRVVIDMWCYRRFGHNEGDEPSFTQPLMYAAIASTPDQRDLRRPADRRGRDRPRVDRRPGRELHRLARGRVRGRASYLPNKADWFDGRWAGLGCRRRPRRTGATSDRDRRGDRCARSADPHHGPRGLRVHKTLQRILDAEGDVRDRREFRLGDRPRRSPSAPWSTRASGAPLRPGQRPRHLQPAPFGLGRPDRRPQIYPADQLPGRPLRGARQPALRSSACSASNMAIARRPAHPGAVGGAVRRLRQRRAGDHRPVHRRRASASGCGQRPRHAAAARL
jgi:2-oxoglutarate dehydrogenase E1 component